MIDMTADNHIFFADLGIKMTLRELGQDDVEIDALFDEKDDIALGAATFDAQATIESAVLTGRQRKNLIIVHPDGRQFKLLTVGTPVAGLTLVTLQQIS